MQKYKYLVCCILTLTLAVVVPIFCDLFYKYLLLNNYNESWYVIISILGIYHKPSPIVNTNLGDVQGIISTSRSGRDFYAFYSIPYAQAPIDSLRFEPPVPAKPWKGILKADKAPTACLQFDAMIRGMVWGEEDCLKLNVFTPNLNPEKLMPVIAYIHGGGFTAGESSMFDPKYFLDHDVVVVIMNYRLGSLGFLNTGDNLIRGNMGLKDQRMALTWIKENIKFFAGNSLQITLMGESAGGASVHYHLISQHRDLFQRAIMQSGNLGCPWALTRNAKHQALRFGKILGCPVDNTSVLVDCLKKMDPRDIVKQHVIIMSPVHKQDDFFPPSIEAVQQDDTFLSENPLVMLERGDFAHIPVIFGVNSGEGGLKTSRLESYSEILGELDLKWNEHIPVLMHYDPKRTDISEKLREQYFSAHENDLDKKDKKINPANDIVNLTAMLGAGIFYEGIHRVANYHSKYSPTYLYYFSYLPETIPSSYTFMRAARPHRWWYPWEANMIKGIMNYYTEKYLWRSRSKDNRKYGASHGDDLGQVWSFSSIVNVRTCSKDYSFSKDIVDTFVQFAKNEQDLRFGKVAWPMLNSSGGNNHLYMQMDRQGEIIQEPFKEDVQFIESLNIRDPLEPNNW